MLVWGETGEFWIPQYPKQIWHILQHRQKKMPNTTTLQNQVETRCHTETIVMYVKIKVYDTDITIT